MFPACVRRLHDLGILNEVGVDVVDAVEIGASHLENGRVEYAVPPLTDTVSNCRSEKEREGWPFVSPGFSRVFNHPVVPGHCHSPLLGVDNLSSRYGNGGGTGMVDTAGAVPRDKLVFIVRLARRR